MLIKSAKELVVYKKAYQLAMEIFELSKNFPTEERYALHLSSRRGIQMKEPSTIISRVRKNL